MLDPRDMPTAADFAREDARAAQVRMDGIDLQLREKDAAINLMEYKLKCLKYLAKDILESGAEQRYAKDIEEILAYTKEDMERVSG